MAEIDWNQLPTLLFHYLNHFYCLWRKVCQCVTQCYVINSEVRLVRCSIPSANRAANQFLLSIESWSSICRATRPADVSTALSYSSLQSSVAAPLRADNFTRYITANTSFFFPHSSRAASWHYQSILISPTDAL